MHEAFAPGEFALYQAPVWLHKTHGLPEPGVNYPDLLLREGRLNAGHLEGRVRGWRNLLAPAFVDVGALGSAPVLSAAA